VIRTKDSSVNVNDIHPILKTFLEDVSNRFDGIVVSSGKDGQHAVINSRHYLGLALDFGKGSSDATAYENFKQYVLEGRNKWHLPNKFAEYQIEDILDEDNHIHIELIPTPKEKAIIYGSYTLVIVLALGLSYLIYKKVMK